MTYGYTMYILYILEAKMEAVIQKWGNSLGLRIPALWAKENKVKSGSKVEVIPEEGKITIIPQKKSLEEMMGYVNKDNLHSEIESGNAIGNEEW